MRKLLTLCAICVFLPSVVSADQHAGVYTWVDQDGIRHYGDKIPAEYADMDKGVVNDYGVIVAEIEGRKTEEELAAEARADELQLQIDLQQRADRALLATYLSVDEILLHRDRRVELFQAQSHVTEMYLRNLKRRLGKLETQAKQFQPYNPDPEAAMVDPDLITDINSTKETIERHEGNLVRFQNDEQQIIARFDGDIYRFKELKGLN